MTISEWHNVGQFVAVSYFAGLLVVLGRHWVQDARRDR